MEPAAPRGLAAPLTAVLAQLQGVQRRGPRYAARCPAHDDQRSSLSLTPGDHRLFLRCFAGCAEEDIARALGLAPGSGGAPRVAGPPAPSPSAGTPPVQRQGRTVAPLAWLAAYCAVPDELLATLPLKADGGRLAFTFRASMPSKVRAVPEKLFTWEPAGLSAPPLWPLPEAELPELIWLCEGETDAIVARYAGLHAYALTKGAGSPPAAEPLAALARRGVRRAAILFDADPAGTAGAARLAERLTEAGITPLVIDLAAWDLVEPLAGQKDLRDVWLAARAAGDDTAESLRHLLSEAVAGVQSDTERQAAAPASSTTLPHALPADSTGERHPAALPVLDPAALAGLAGDIVRVLEPATEADPAGLLLSLLAAFTNAAGNGPHCMVGQTRHELRLWPVLVGPTSKGRKGSSWSPVRALMAQAAPAWATDNVLSGLSSGEGLIWAVRDPVTRTERDERGGERLVTVDSGVADKRLLVLETEFAAPLKQMLREGNILSTVLRQAWDDGTLRTLVKTNPARATGAHITVIGHAVAEEVRRYLRASDVAGGFANRFLWACVRRAQVLPEGGTLDAVALAEVSGRLARALEQARTDAGLLTRDAAATALWHDVYPELTAEQPGMAALLAAVLGRAEVQVLRLSAAYALLDGARQIGERQLRAALALWRYCEESATWIFGEQTGDRVIDTIAAALRQAGETGLSRSELRNVAGHNVRGERVDGALGVLAVHGRAVCERQQTGGRPVEVWRWQG